MAKIDSEYHDLLLDILQHGFKYEDPNRKDVQRIQIPSYQIKHNFKDGFPAITTKQLYWKGVVGELLWFLRGDTNIKYLVDNGINIWNKDAYNYNELRLANEPASYDVWLKHLTKNSGDLGRIYGAQWRNWHMSCDSFGQKNLTKDGYEELDQISNLIKGLKETPMGTKHIVTAWNPAELDSMALPPCHWSFEVLVEPINNKPVFGKNTEFYYANEPEYQFTLKWHQRSCDVFLGIPFNIASYALLAQILGKMTNMIPKGIIGDLSNVHIYEPHLDAVKEQLNRDIDKYNNCDLSIDSLTQVQLEEGLKHIDNKNIVINNFNLKNYESYPSIKAEMLTYNK